MKRLKDKTFVILASIVMLLGALYYVIFERWVITVDDAQVKSVLVSVRTEVDGLVTESAIKRVGEYVENGETLVVIDDAVILKKIEQSEMRSSIVDNKISELEQRIAIINEEASIDNEILDAARKILLSNIELNKYELERSSRLVNLMNNDVLKDSIPIVDLEQIEIRHYEKLVSYRTLPISLHEIGLKKKKVSLESSKAQLLFKEIEAQRLKKNVELSLRQSLEYERQKHYYSAGFDGFLDEVYVSKGEYVRKGHRIYLLHSPEDVYIEANFYEEDFQHLEVGKQVTIKLDAYRDTTLKGTISKIGTVTDSQLSLIPTTKINSSFVRVRQKIPVEVQLPKNRPRVMPGMLATVSFRE